MSHQVTGSRCVIKSNILFNDLNVIMKTAKIFKSGNSQALRLPKEFQFHSNEVEIFRRGNDVIIREKPKNLKYAFELLASLPNDFFAEERDDSQPQERVFFNEFTLSFGHQYLYSSCQEKTIKCFS